LPKPYIQEYISINDIPDSFFTELGCDQSFYFSKLFLASFEEAHSTINYHYLVFLSNEKPIAIAILQQLCVSLENISKNLPYYLKVATTVKSYFNSKKTHILVCGNVFLSGQYGLWIKEGTNRINIFDLLSQKLRSLQNTTKASVCLLKDFNSSQNNAASSAQKQHFQPFTVAPNMRIKVVWNNFENYKDSLKSKYRIKINKADTTSKALIKKSLTALQIRNHQEILKKLYLNVASNASFNTAIIAIETYALLKERFPNNVYFDTYSKNGKIVGFKTAFVTAGLLTAHYIGLDYAINKTDAIYPRMLNDYLRLGLLLGVKDINLGRTASEIKSTLGAIPEHLTCYIKNRRTVANVLFKPFVHAIKMTEYKQHHPFKK